MIQTGAGDPALKSSLKGQLSSPFDVDIKECESRSLSGLDEAPQSPDGQDNQPVAGDSVHFRCASSQFGHLASQQTKPVGAFSHAHDKLNIDIPKRTISNEEITSPALETLAINSIPPTTIQAPNMAAVTAILTVPPPPLRRPSSSEPRVDNNWPAAMMNTTFFGDCHVHPHERTNKLNHFCLGCGPTDPRGTELCQYCVPNHKLHCDGQCIQIYRYMYNDILRVSSINKLLDISGIQQYRANDHPAVHLRPLGPPANKSPYVKDCQGGCGRNLDPQWEYCSIACKYGYNVGVPAGGGAPRAARNAAPRQPKRHHGSNISNGTTFTAGTTCERMQSNYWDDEEMDAAIMQMKRRLSAKRSAAARAAATGAKRRKAEFPTRSPSI